MGASASTSQEPVRHRERRSTLALTVVGVGLIVSALAITASQVEVTDGDLGVTRPCGSVLDGIADRSGWETWWARDLDEPDDAVRAALVRTTRCPGAVNDGIVLAAVLGAVGAAALVVALRRTSRRSERPPAGDVERRLARLGEVVSWAGAGLTVLGLGALLLLLADADSTLFLYTDRAVVGAAGLVVLVPAIALFAMGRALAIAARDRDRPTAAGPQAVDHD